MKNNFFFLFISGECHPIETHKQIPRDFQTKSWVVLPTTRK
jgi:hypothetical protein